MQYQKKIKTLAELKPICESITQSGKKTVTTNGCFDILHVGHVRYLNQAKELGAVLIVGINSDLSVKKIKGPSRPINTESTRAEVLAALACVDYVLIFPEDTPVKFIETLKPSIHVKGGDYNGVEIPEKKVVESYGGEMRFLSFVDGFSTTGLLDKLSKNASQ